MTRKALLQSLAAAVTGAAVAHGQSATIAEIPHERGDLLALEFPYNVSQKQLDKIRAWLKPIEHKHNITILVLEGGAQLRNPSSAGFSPITINIGTDALEAETATK